MNQRKLYTAMGVFHVCTGRDGKKVPIVMIGQQDHQLDPQELVVWSVLYWRLLDQSGVERRYEEMLRSLPLTEYRTLAHCLARLVTRGLVLEGVGETEADALYDLMGGLYVVPLRIGFFTRIGAFLKAVVVDGHTIHEAGILFRSPKLRDSERRVLALVRQTILSTAELVKCVELGVTDLTTTEKVMDALYNDADTTSDNLPDLMYGAASRNEITQAVSNLYLNRKITFARV